jgi:hypothetical protein
MIQNPLCSLEFGERQIYESNHLNPNKATNRILYVVNGSASKPQGLMFLTVIFSNRYTARYVILANCEKIRLFMAERSVQ